MNVLEYRSSPRPSYTISSSIGEATGQLSPRGPLGLISSWRPRLLPSGSRTHKGDRFLGPRTLPRARGTPGASTRTARVPCGSSTTTGRERREGCLCRPTPRRRIWKRS
ncbi:hypothetical protein CCHR01_04655 [Colletotrichum chrysophilum]|uniref:Uncharacterized protein n=1 Tax=Colletotrichum chrysophilum TaxID=1836956 RepID=A0AAD9AVS6_9PEZI|nr:hypothetical protein CCHR01_04655 [Colletotrichum chrysophilum]